MRKANAAGTRAPTNAKAIVEIRPIAQQNAIAPSGALNRLAEEVTTSIAVTPQTIMAPRTSPLTARYAIILAHTMPFSAKRAVCRQYSLRVKTRLSASESWRSSTVP